MAANASNNPTLLDLARVTDPDGKIARVAEILNEDNELLDDMSWQHGNMTLGHRSTARTGIPEPTWRKAYGGVQPTKSTTRQVDDTIGMLRAYAEVDADLVDLHDNREEYLLQQNRPFLEGMTQELTATVLYGNAGTQPEAFTGIMPRFNQLTGVESADNIIDAGGTGNDNASILLVNWSPTTVYGIVPKGSEAGLKIDYKGRVTLEDASNGSNTGRMEAYRTYYTWDAGLVVEDWRFIVRICNIDKSALTKDAATGADLCDLMFQAIERLPTSARGGRMAFYMSRDILTKVRQQATYGTKNSTLTVENVGGKRIRLFQEIPLKRVDAMAADETRVV